MKKRSILVFMLVLLPAMFIKAEAKKVTVNEFVTEFNRLAEDYSSNGLIEKVEASLDSDNKNIKVAVDDDNILLSYTDDYLEYTRTSGAPTEPNIGEMMLDTIVFNALLETMFSLAGVSKDYSAAIPSDYNNDFDKYNVVFTLKEYTYNISKDDGSSNEGQASYVDNYKIGFDTEKIAEYAKVYGTETSSKKYSNLVPKLSLTIASDGKTMYSLDLDYTPKDDDDTPYCKVFRAEAVDGNYKNIVGGSGDSDWSMGCIQKTEELLQVDTSAQTNKVYYYKAQVIGSEKYTDIFKVDLVNKTIENLTTGEKTNVADTESKDNPSDKEESSDTKTDDKELQNPNTGDFLPFIPIFFLMLASFVTWCKVGNRFARI